MDQNKKKVTIKDIAKLAGVSIASVSRILNHTGRYSKKTEEKVLKIVEEYGYTINTAAKSLRSENTKTIALLIPDITNEFFSKIAFYCEQYLREHGYLLFICNSRNNPDIEINYLTEFARKNVDGIIAVSSLNTIPKPLKISSIPIVTLDRISSSHIPAVVTDDYKGSLEATELLIKKGCHHIYGLIPSSQPGKTARERGFIDTLNKHHLYSPQQLICMRISKNSAMEAETRVYQLLEENPQVDALYCGSDRIALGALYACKRREKKVPEDIKIIGYDNSTYSQLPSPSLSTISRSSKNLSIKACELLLKIINKEECDLTQRIYEPTHIIERESTK